MKSEQELIKRGVLYIAWGKAHVEVARRSARSVRKHNPGLPTALFCRDGDDTSGFDFAERIPSSVARPKIDLLAHSPFAETLYLDNDTLVRSDLSDLFRLLERFEICGTHVSMWQKPKHNRQWREPVPQSFPQINCGVLLIRNTTATRELIAEWAIAYKEARFGEDQVTFRELLWRSDVRFYVFPSQYNKRIFEFSEHFYSDLPRPRILHLSILQPQKNPFLRWISNLVR